MLNIYFSRLKKKTKKMYEGKISSVIQLAKPELGMPVVYAPYFHMNARCSETNSKDFAYSKLENNYCSFVFNL